MKLRYWYAIIWVFFLVSCGKNIVTKPQKLLSEKEMEGLMYDLAMLDALKSVDYQLMDTVKLDVNELIYKKYGIDSLSLVENMIYYASSPKQYDNIIRKVDVRLQKERDEFSEKSHQTEKFPPDEQDLDINSLEDVEPLN